MADTKYAGNKQMTDLRDRIATALAEAQEAHNGLSDLELADAVIETLGLQPEWSVGDDEAGRVLWGEDEPLPPGQEIQIRYITEWKKE